MSKSVYSAPVRKPKHAQCTGKYEHCSPESVLVECTIAGDAYRFCKPCLAKLDILVQQNMDRPRKTHKEQGCHEMDE